jgi:peptidoglycan-associated lipoprotein
MRLMKATQFASIFATALLLAACASTPETAGDAASTGTETATTAAAPGSREDFQINVGDRVFFDYDSYEVTPDARGQLEKQAAWLQTYPETTVTIEGHCDERGTREYNLALGERRASAVKNYLVALGIDPNRVQTISYGKERPEVLGSDDAAWSKNRRGVTVIN